MPEAQSLALPLRDCQWQEEPAGAAKAIKKGLRAAAESSVNVGPPYCLTLRSVSAVGASVGPAQRQASVWVWGGYGGGSGVRRL